jgi:alkylation response protein AidB-like acyl-CoA dehydrogenase
MLGQRRHCPVEARGSKKRREKLLARIYLANLHGTETAVDVTSVAHRLGGGTAAYADSPLLRTLNDVEAARQHYQFAHEHRIRLGQILGGCDVTYPPYIM